MSDEKDISKVLNRTNFQQPTRYPERVLLFGGGNFMRAFAAWMISEMNEKAGFAGEITVVKPTPGGVYPELKAQDGLYHVWTRGLQSGQVIDEFQLISCVRRSVAPYENWDAFLATAELPAMRFIISNTTEAGIVFDPDDVWSEANCPSSFPAKLTRWLYHRYQFFGGSAGSGCIILPCELIEKNGQVLLQCVQSYIQHWQLPVKFADWVANANTFADTLVDRIVPGFPKNQEIPLSVQDDLVVCAEPYHLWAIQAAETVSEVFPAQKAGLNVVWTTDLDQFRTLKVRILNGLHTIMTPVAYLSGMRTVGETLQNEALKAYLQQVLAQEIVPTLPFPEEVSLQYAATVWERFENPFVQHRLADIALNSISKFRARVLPSLLTYMAAKGEVPIGICRAFAAMLIWYSGSWKGESLPVRDNAAVVSDMQQYWQHPETLVGRVLGREDWWGQDLRTLPGLEQAINQRIRDWNK